MIQSAVNKVIVQVKTKYIRNFTSILKMAAIQNNSSIDPSDYCNIIGTVVSAPKSISKRREYKGFSKDDIQEGDTVIFSNYVIGTTVQTEPEADPIFKNMFWYKGQEYWMVNIDQLYAVIRDGEIRMQNDYVMLVDLEAPPKIILTTNVKKRIGAATGTISNIAYNDELRKGDEVYFKSSQIRNYQINEKPFGILQRHQILGKKKKEKQPLVL